MALVPDPSLKATTTEATPLLAKQEEPASKEPWLKPIHLVLLCGFLVSLSFGVTQVPLVYVFRVMTCEAYYETHPDPLPGRDRCALPVIEAGTARAVALLGFSTTFFGVANLFLTGWGIKRFGIKSALALQVFWPAARLAVQNIGVMVGGAKGIIIVQSSQVATIVGGPNGYLLALNTYVTEVTEHRQRTGSLGRLQGYNMFGSAFGFLIGGVLADLFGIITPFQVALILFLASTVYVLICLPYISPKQGSDKGSSGSSRILGPLKTLMPSKWVFPNGKVKTESGAIILATGAFLAVLATGYIPTMLQMYATDVFGFGTKRNSYLVSMHSFLRGAFLTFAFPRIISTGRRWTEKHKVAQPAAPASTSTSPSTSGTAIPSSQKNLAAAMQDEEEQSPLLLPPSPHTNKHQHEPHHQPPNQDPDLETFTFDLHYTRLSLLLDATLTFPATLLSTPRQLYLLALLLPLASGTASAAKGTILQLTPPSSRVDALSAIAFVEMVARLSTTFVFGLIFAALAQVGRVQWVFACDAGVAVAGVGVLLFCGFPGEGGRRLEESKKRTRGGLEGDDENEVGDGR